MQTKPVTHTATPWRTGDTGVTVFGPPNGNPSPETIGSIRNRANAAFIVKSVNCHDELLQTVKDLLEAIHSGLERVISDEEMEAMMKARSVIAKAEQRGTKL